MAIFKCKLCGGDLNVEGDSKIIECEYCGTTQTVPCLEDERKDQRASEIQKAQYRILNLCQHCGGSFKGLFAKKCSSCGKEKDY